MGGTHWWWVIGGFDKIIAEVNTNEKMVLREKLKSTKVTKSNT